MAKKRAGTHVIGGVTFIYDGKSIMGRSWPLKVCPECGSKRRVGPGEVSNVRTGRTSGLCAICGRSGRPRRNQDEHCDNGAIIHWSQRTEDNKIPVTFACGHSATPKLTSNVRFVRTSTGLCLSCVNKLKARSGPDHHNWKGGRAIDSDGYVLLATRVLSPDDQALAVSMADNHGYVREHRLVMARQLGRPLEPNEHVHHLNGIKDNNRPENLEIVQSPAEHGGANGATVNRLRKEIARLQQLLNEAEVEY